MKYITFLFFTFLSFNAFALTLQVITKDSSKGTILIRGVEDAKKLYNLMAVTPVENMGRAVKEIESIEKNFKINCVDSLKYKMTICTLTVFNHGEGVKVEKSSNTVAIHFQEENAKEIYNVLKDGDKKIVTYKTSDQKVIINSHDQSFTLTTHF